MKIESNREHLADGRALRAHTLSHNRRLISYASLSWTLTLDSEDQGLEGVYRMHVMDLASRRLVPHLLGSLERDCDHLGCDLVLLNSLAAGYAVETGIAIRHSQERAEDLLREQLGAEHGHQ